MIHNVGINSKVYYNQNIKSHIELNMNDAFAHVKILMKLKKTLNAISTKIFSSLKSMTFRILSLLIILFIYNTLYLHLQLSQESKHFSIKIPLFEPQRFYPIKHIALKVTKNGMNTDIDLANDCHRQKRKLLRPLVMDAV